MRNENFAKLNLFRGYVFDQFDPIFTIVDEVDGHDVDPGRGVVETVVYQIHLGRPEQVFQFHSGDSVVTFAVIAGFPGLYLDETPYWSVPAYQIDLPIMGTVIGGYIPVSLRHQIVQGDLFAPFAKIMIIGKCFHAAIFALF